jgi:hypothetical protein
VAASSAGNGFFIVQTEGNIFNVILRRLFVELAALVICHFWRNVVQREIPDRTRSEIPLPIIPLVIGRIGRATRGLDLLRDEVMPYFLCFAK